MINISKIKPGDTVTIGPFTVKEIVKNEVWLKIDGEEPYWIWARADQIVAHRPSREFQVGDRVRRKGTFSEGTIEAISRGKAWVLLGNGAEVIWTLSELILVEGGE
jgi:hypothetical protein